MSCGAQKFNYAWPLEPGTQEVSPMWAGFILPLWWLQLLLQFTCRQGWPLDWLWDLATAAVVQRWVGPFPKSTARPGYGCCVALVDGAGSQLSFETCL